MTAPLDATLPAPSFVDRDAPAITAELVTLYERLSGRALHPAQFERVFIDVIAYRDVLLRQSIQRAAERNLLAFASFPELDWLGEFWGVARLPARAAATILRLTAADGGPVTVPAGTRVESKDGEVRFALDADAVIAPGDSIEARATATAPGTRGNGYQPGEIARIVDPVSGLAGVVNLSVSHGGAAVEDDDRLRTRIREAPERLSVAGPVGAYRWHAMSAHQDIVDAAVSSPEPGIVHVTVLTRAGEPTAGMIDIVQAALDDERVRPLTDQVAVRTPEPISYTINATITLKPQADGPAVLKAARAAAERYAERLEAGLGRAIVPNRLIAETFVDGVHDIHLAAPEARDLAPHQWARADAITVALDT